MSACLLRACLGVEAILTAPSSASIALLSSAKACTRAPVIFYQGKTKHILKLSIDSGGEDVLYDSGTSAMDGTLALHMEIFIILPKKVCSVA